MLIAILIISLLCPVAPLVCRWAPRRLVPVLSVVPAAVAVYFATRIEAVRAGAPLLERYAWAPALDLSLTLRLDGLSLVFAILVLGVGALVVLYAGAYLDQEPRRGRFLGFLFLFMASMLGLVLADNLFGLFVFWELTSISSYMLIGFHHEKEAARASALQALLVTGGGGLALLLGLIILAHVAGTASISELPALRDTIVRSDLYTPMLLLLLAGAFTKSAQFPLHIWLPNAMEAPTPASTYLHAATMVKAGVFLLARLSPSVGGTELWTYSVSIVGTATMFVGAFQALRETALKRILAFTTVSALGMLVLLAGIGTPLAARSLVVFVIAHALYKGALFFVAGVLDHETGEKDVLRLGGLRRSMPKTTVIAVVAALSMAPFPPLFGFVAKEMLYESTWSSPVLAMTISAVAVIANMMLMAAALVLGLDPYFHEQRTTKRAPHDPPWTLWVPPGVLAALGLSLPLALALLGERLVDPAAAAIIDTAPTDALSLWHGITPALGLSVLTTAGGVALYRARHWIRARNVPIVLIDATLSGRWFAPAFARLYGLAKAQTKTIQGGSLTTYLEVTLVFACAATGYALLRLDLFEVAPTFSDTPLHEGVTVAVMVVAAVAAVRAKSRLFAVAAMGVVGYSIALIFVFYGAPDLAMTLFVVETLTVVLFGLAFRHLPRFSTLSSPAARGRDALVAIATGVVISGLLYVAATVQTNPAIAHYYLDHSLTAGRGRNIVNVILVDFRGLDTLGEITVLSAAAVAVAALLKLRRGGAA